MKVKWSILSVEEGTDTGGDPETDTDPEPDLVSMAKKQVEVGGSAKGAGTLGDLELERFLDKVSL